MLVVVLVIFGLAVERQKTPNVRNIASAIVAQYGWYQKNNTPFLDSGGMQIWVGKSPLFLEHFKCVTFLPMNSQSRGFKRYLQIQGHNNRPKEKGKKVAMAELNRGQVVATSRGSSLAATHLSLEWPFLYGEHDLV